MGLKEKQEKLAQLREEISKCQKCPLYNSRTNTVPGEGDPNAEIMFIGEAPGFSEDQKGVPFCGNAGEFLEELLESINLKREDVFITNTLKCRPPENRDPLPEEKSACREYLEEQIAVINPKIVVTLGRHSTETYLPGLGGISKLRAKLYHRPNGIYYFPLYHPAAALHNGAMRQTLIDDFAKLPMALKKIETETAVVLQEQQNQTLF